MESPPATRLRQRKRLNYVDKYEEFVDNKYEKFVKTKSPTKFWSNSEVNRQINSIWTEIQSIEDKTGDKKLPKKIFDVCQKLGVSPEMICDHVGQQMIYTKKLLRDKMQLGPNGEAVSITPKLEDYIWSGLGNTKTFWSQDYVKKIIREAQSSKISREEGASKLGVSERKLVIKIKELNDADELGAYERKRQENIAERMKLFSELGINDLKNGARHIKRPYRKEVVKRRPKSVRIQKKKLRKKIEGTSLMKLPKLNIIPIPVMGSLALSQTLALFQDREEKTGFLDCFAKDVQHQVVDSSNYCLPQPMDLEVIAMTQLTQGLIQSCDAIKGIIKKCLSKLFSFHPRPCCYFVPTILLQLHKHLQCFTIFKVQNSSLPVEMIMAKLAFGSVMTKHYVCDLIPVPLTASLSVNSSIHSS